MKLMINDNLVDASEISHVSDYGGEVEVFRYDNLAVKLFKNISFKKRRHLNEDEIAYFANIKTKRILLPTGKVKRKESSIENYSYDDILDLNQNDIFKYLTLIKILSTSDSELVGYTEKFIDGKKNIFDIKVDNLLNELEIIYEDVKLLNDNSVILNDLHKYNSIYNGSLYLTDPGNYKISDMSEIVPYVFFDLDDEEENGISIEKWNIESVNGFIEEYIFSNYPDVLDYLHKIKEEKEIMYYQDVFDLVFNREETLSDNIKTLIKKI